MTHPFSKFPACRRAFFLALAGFAAGMVMAASPAAAKDFKANYDVQYGLNMESGLMHVVQKVTLINQAPNLRASSYSLTLENNSFSSLVARDSGGTMKYTQSKNEQGSPVLTFTFNDKVVGVGNKLLWTIEYDSPTLAQHHGHTWDITIPRVKEHPSYDIGDYDVRLTVPKQAGPVAYISPAVAKTQSDSSQHIFSFTRDQVLPTGIVATFGEFQLFSFTLKYHLHNPNLGQASTEIALPPDIEGYQQIIFDSLTPKPSGIRTDHDGNSLATYLLASHQNLDVTFTGWVKTLAKKPDLGSKATMKELPADLVRQYTKEQPFWQTSDPKIVEKTRAITDPDKPVVENAKAIYDYVTATLQYNTARINKDLKRLGASKAFVDPKNAVCMEFTDVFITMARIAGIPAREVDGYAYTSDSANHPIFYPGLGSDILHAWVEVYLPGSGWVMIDPTWGSTTGGVDFFGRIDMNRIAFAVKGTSSSAPFAAGSYKTNDKQDGDVKVDFASKGGDSRREISIDVDSADVIAGIGSTLPMTIKNNGNVALYGIDIKPKLPSPFTISRSIQLPSVLLPGQNIVVPLPLRTPSWLNGADGTMRLTGMAKDVLGQTATVDQQQPLRSRPFFAAVIIPILVFLALVVAAVGGGWFGLHRLYHRNQPTIPTAPGQPTQP